MRNSKPHFHKDEFGFLVKCYHGTKNNLTSATFWIGVTVSFPLEHFIWEKLPGFRAITHWLGL